MERQEEGVSLASLFPSFTFISGSNFLSCCSLSPTINSLARVSRRESKRRVPRAFSLSGLQTQTKFFSVHKPFQKYFRNNTNTVLAKTTENKNCSHVRSDQANPNAAPSLQTWFAFNQRFFRSLSSNFGAKNNFSSRFRSLAEPASSHQVYSPSS